jgi:hypothetical protein
MTKNHVNPVPNWLFNVTFRAPWDTNLENELNELECISIGLPENETVTSEVHFFGSSMTVPVKRKYGGEVTAEFFDKKGSGDYLINIATSTGDVDPFSERKEFKYKIDKVIIDVFPINIKRIYKRYTLFNPVITKFSYSEGLNTEGDSALRYNVSIHYDYWTIDNAVPSTLADDTKE